MYHAHVCELLWSHVGIQDILHLRRAVRSCPVIMTTTRLCSPVSSFFSLSFNYLSLPSAMLPSIRSVDHRARRWARTGLTEEQSHPSIPLTQSVTLLITLYGPSCALVIDSAHRTLSLTRPKSSRFSRLELVAIPPPVPKTLL